VHRIAAGTHLNSFVGKLPKNRPKKKKTLRKKTQEFPACGFFFFFFSTQKRGGAKAGKERGEEDLSTKQRSTFFTR
jgi:hypothetical protein